MLTECINCGIKYSFLDQRQDPPQTQVIHFRRIFSLRALSYMTCRKKNKKDSESDKNSVDDREIEIESVRVCVWMRLHIRKLSTLDNMHLSQQSMFCHIIQDTHATRESDR